MNVYTCVDHGGHWPVGVASVVVAQSEYRARQLLEAALSKEGLSHRGFTLQELDTSKAHAVILNNGDY